MNRIAVFKKKGFYSFQSISGTSNTGTKQKVSFHFFVGKNFVAEVFLPVNFFKRLSSSEKRVPIPMPARQLFQGITFVRHCPIQDTLRSNI